MSKNEKIKKNFSAAAYEMFGVGRPVEEAPAAKEAPAQVKEPAVPAAEPAAAAPAVKEAPAKEKNTTYIAAGCTLEGTLKMDGNVEIMGQFKGTLDVTGYVVLHSDTTATVNAAELRLIDCKYVGDCHVTGRVSVDGKSSVEGNIYAADLDCAGAVKGDVHVENQTVFRATSRMDGNVETKTIAVEQGATVLGNVKM